MSRDEEIYAAAVELPEVERAAFLNRACEGDHSLRARLEALLLANDEAETFFEAVAPVRMATMPEEKPGERIGRYRLLQKIGEGGCGVVYMAEQEVPVRRRIALKVIKLGMDTKEVIARFEAERQALALMDHPNIARVLDAGETETGRPFFVMELVGGIPITRYCDEQNLPMAERLRLFVQVCHAIQHAHQKGIIHRDIKPSNVLVAVHDGAPTPKVIDFGIAKATEGKLTDHTVFTAFEQFIGTPAYMSPEQTQIGGIDVDTRSDIYSLGVLLYELLTGRPPFDPKALVQHGIDEVRRIIREIDPPRPSTCLTTLAAADRDAVARLRSTEPAQLSTLMRGDLDWIVMKALEKNRARRYETANGLAADIRRHLENEPVVARPPSAAYRVRKLAARHNVAFAASAAIAFSLIAGSIVSAVLYIRANAARTRAVAAEKSETALRWQVESARVAEAAQSSRTSQALAEQLFRSGRTPEALAHLVRAARADPSNLTISPRLASALVYRSFAEAVGKPFVHTSPLRYAGYIGDGRRVLTWTRDGSVYVWETESGRLLTTLKRAVRFDYGSGLSVSPDGNRFATLVAEGIVNVADLESGRLCFPPLRHEYRVLNIGYSPDNRWLACVSSNELKIWDAATGEIKGSVSFAFDSLGSFAISPDGTRLVTSGRGIRIWRLPGGEPLVPTMHTQVVRDGDAWIEFSPDGELIKLTTGGAGAAVHLFEGTTGTRIGEKMEHPGSLRSWFSKRGGMVVTTSTDGWARVWQVPSGKLLTEVECPAGNALFAADDRFLVTHGGDGAARVWDVQSGQPVVESIRVGDVSGIDVSRDGSELLTASRDGAVHRWRIGAGAVKPMQVTPKGAFAVQRNAAGATTAWALYPDFMQKLDLISGSSIGPPRSFPAPIRAGGLSPNEQVLAVFTQAGSAELWNFGPAELTRRRLGEAPTGRIDVRFSPNSSYLAISNDGGTRVWQTDSGELIAGPIPGRTIEFQRGPEPFSPSSRYLATKSNAERSLAVLDLQTRRLGERMLHPGRIWGVGFSPDDRLVSSAGGSDEAVRIWNHVAASEVREALAHRNLTRGTTFSADGRRLLTWTRTETNHWDVATGKLLGSIQAGSDIDPAIFNTDSSRIATYALNGRELRVFDATTGSLLVEPIIGAASVEPPAYPFGGQSISFSADGRFLISAKPGNARALLVWPLPPPTAAPAPDWLLRLATVLAGGEINAQGELEARKLKAGAFDAMRRDLDALPDHAPFVAWGRWFLADRATRAIAPGFTLTASEVAQLGRGN